MRILSKAVAAVAVVIFPVLPAAASQGPGASPGTATGLEQALLVGGIAAAIGFGLLMKLRRRQPRGQSPSTD